MLRAHRLDDDGGTVLVRLSVRDTGVGIAAEQLPRPFREQAADTETVSRHRHHGARILVAEDNPIHQDVLLGVLESVGIDADMAENGQEAIALAASGQHRLALTANAFAEDWQACQAATAWRRDAAWRPAGQPWQ